MPYWGSRDVTSGNFVDHDPTPYSGGYDIAFTYGRPLPPSDEICYPVSVAGNLDIQRPQYYSDSHSSTFSTVDPIKDDLYSRQRPKPQPAYGFHPHAQVDYGNQSHGHEGITCAELKGATDYALGYGGIPQFQEYASSYGQGYVHAEYGSGYQGGKNPHHEFESRPELSFGYGREETKSHWEGEFGDGGYMRNEHYPYGGAARFTRPSYGDDCHNTGYPKPTYYGREEGYGHSKECNDSDDDEQNRQEYQKIQHHPYRNY